MLSPMLRAALVLGLLSAVGPFAIDMFLPALPAIAADLQTTATRTQGTISFYFLAFGLAQMIYGPWSDQVGRKVPIYAGLTVFFAGSVLAAIAPTVDLLIAARVAQGLGGASLMVVTRAIIRDQFTGYEATRLMSLVILVFSVSPLLAPMSGAALILLFSWRAIFGAMAVAAALAFVLTMVFQPETLKPENRVPINIRAMLSSSARLLRDPTFMGLTLVGGSGLAAFFVFVASGAFVYEQAFGLTPTQFSLAFSVNAMGFIASSQASAPLMKRWGTLRLISIGTAGFTLGMLALLGLCLSGMATLPVLMAGLMVGFASMGLVIPTTMVAALDPHGDIAGLASSLGGTLQMMLGGVMVFLGGMFFDGSATPMVATMTVCALCSVALMVMVSRRQRKVVSA